MPVKVGVVSNTKLCLPLLSFLNNQNKAGVAFYLGSSAALGSDKEEVLAFCRANNIPATIEQGKEDLYNWQQFYDPDIVFITGYSKKIDVTRLGGVLSGIYNIHFGQLPEFRGPSPVFWQLKKGVTDLWLTIHLLTERFDSGDIVWEYPLKNEEYHSYNYVNYIFSELQVRGVFEVLDIINKKKPSNKRVQCESKSNYNKKPELTDVMISWETMTAKEIVDLTKACNSWNNGASTVINGHELKIIDATAISKNSVVDPAGTINVNNNAFSVSCMNNTTLSINFFNVNDTPIPARHASAYGLKTGQRFLNRL